VLFPIPKERAIEMLEPVKFMVRLEKPAAAGDPTSNQQAE
jgi:hypothetical protein